MWQIIFQIAPIFFWFAAVAAMRPLALSRTASRIAGAVFAAAFVKFTFFEIAGGNCFNPDLPKVLIWFYGWAYGVAFFMMAALVAAALAYAVMRRRGRGVAVRAKRLFAAVALVASAVVSTYGMYESVRNPSVREIEIAWKELPEAFDGYRIAHLSDLHCSSAAKRERFERIVASVNALGVDLIALTGDFVDGSVADRIDDFSPLAAIRAKDGVVCCTGNHEAYWDWPGWSAEFRKWGFALPEADGTKIVRRDGAALAFGALRDPAFGWYLADAADAFSAAPEGTFRILLYHRPFTEKIGAARADVRLQLSGHTHGGAMPVLRQLVSLANEGHVRGLYEFAPGCFLHVSPGTGQWAGFPLRILTPAEITVIRLKCIRQTVAARSASAPYHAVSYHAVRNDAAGVKIPF